MDTSANLIINVHWKILIYYKGTWTSLSFTSVMLVLHKNASENHLESQ